MIRKQSRNRRPIRIDLPKSKPVMAFLQARMGSTRLPGKVLMPIRGQSILERAIRRLRAAPLLDEVVVLTTGLSEDNAVVKESRRLGIRVHRGPENDVLQRFHEAAEKLQPEIIIRATADNPLIEIGSIERIIRALCFNCLDYCMERDLPYGTATEAFTAEALRRVHSRAQEARHREHVTLYIKEHPEEFRTCFLMPPRFLRLPQIRLTVDTLEDFIFVGQVIHGLPGKGLPQPLRDYLPLALAILRERECKALASS